MFTTKALPTNTEDSESGNVLSRMASIQFFITRFLYKFAIFDRLLAMTDTENSIDIGSAKVWFEQPDLLCIRIKDGERLTSEDAARIIAWSWERSGGKKYRMLSIPDPGANISPDIRKTLADPERVNRVIADAMVVTNFPHRLLADFYIRFNKPSVPTKLFATEESARSWLNSL